MLHLDNSTLVGGVEYVFGIYGIPWQAIREALETAATASAAEQGSGVAASATALGSLADGLGAFLAWARHEPSVFEIVAGPYFLLLFWTNLRWWRFGRGKGPFIGGPGDVVPALATRVIYSSFWLAVNHSPSHEYHSYSHRAIHRFTPRNSPIHR